MWISALHNANWNFIHWFRFLFSYIVNFALLMIMIGCLCLSCSFHWWVMYKYNKGNGTLFQRGVIWFWCISNFKLVSMKSTLVMLDFFLFYCHLFHFLTFFLLCHLCLSHWLPLPKEVVMVSLIRFKFDSFYF